MTCKRAQALISLFLDELLDPAQQTRLNRHLGGCVECSAYLQDLQAGLSALHAEPLAEPSVNFDWNLRRKLQQAQLEAWRYADVDAGRDFWPRFLLSAAAALLLAVGGGYTAYRLAQAPPMPPAPVAGAPAPGAVAGGDLGIPAAPQPFPGAPADQAGLRVVGGSQRSSAAASERGAIQTADPLRPLLPFAGAVDSLKPAADADSLR